MIKFICKISQEYDINKNKIEKGDMTEILKVESQFKIIIDRRVFFNDDYFPILEFFYQFDNWINSNSQISKFEYESIESDEKPIVAFFKRDNKWNIFSVWQNYKEITEFNLADIINQYNICKKDTFNQLKLI